MPLLIMKRQFILVLILTIIGIEMFPIARANDRELSPEYLAVACSRSCTFDAQALTRVSRFSGENIKLTAYIPGCQLHKPWDPLGKGSLAISDVNRTIVADVPLIDRGISEQTYISLPHLNQSCEVRLQIYNSRSLLVFINGVIVSEMRYNEPVYGLASWSINNTHSINGNVWIQGIKAHKTIYTSWEVLDISLTMLGALLATWKLTDSILCLSPRPHNIRKVVWGSGENT